MCLTSSSNPRVLDGLSWTDLVFFLCFTFRFNFSATSVRDSKILHLLFARRYFFPILFILFLRASLVLVTADNGIVLLLLNTVL
ncbi:hypothetical protein Hanom_Chr11g00982601 [Helianthus anomalus]